MRKVLMYAAAVAFLIYEMALQVSPSVMTHELMRDFSIGAHTLGLMAAFYFFSYTAMQIPAGILFDHISPRIVIPAAIVICSGGALFFADTHSVELAAFGRLLMGIGSAFAFIGVLVVSSRWFSPSWFAFLVGIAQLLAAVGALGGELPLAYWIEYTPWREVISTMAIGGIFLSIFALVILRSHPSDKMVAHAHPPFLPSILEVFRLSQTWWVALYAFALWAPVAVFASLWGVPYLMVKWNVSREASASAVSMVWIGLAITSPFIGYLSDKIGRRCILTTIAAAVGLFASLILFYAPGLPWWVTHVLLFFFGVAAAGQILTFALVKDLNRPTVMATAIGFNNMAVVIGGAVLQPLVGYILHLFPQGIDLSNVMTYQVIGYEIALSVVPITFFIGLIASVFLIRETFCKPRFDSYSDHLL